MADGRDLLFTRSTLGPVGDAGLLILRVGIGLALAFAHGLGKLPPSEGFIGMIGNLGFPAPAFFAWMVLLAEFGGGLMLAAGLLTRPFGLLVTIHFILVFLIPHAGDSFGDRELPFIFLIWGATLMLTGPGRYSLDWLIGRNRTTADQHATTTSASRR